VRRRERVEEKRWNYHVCIVYLYDSVGCRYLVLLGSRTLVCFSKSFTKWDMEYRNWAVSFLIPPPLPIPDPVLRNGKSLETQSLNAT